MEVLVVADGHYYKDDAGNVYAETTYDYNFYRRYLTAFDKVTAIVRVEHVHEAPAGCKLSSGENVEFLEFPAYTGPIEYAKIYFKLLRLTKAYCKRFDCAVFRLPAATANIVAKEYSKLHKPFAVELVIDVWENFAPHTIDSPLRPLIRVLWTHFVKKMCRKADGVSYVTSRYLQERYPCRAMENRAGYFTSFYSSVELPDDAFASPREYQPKDTWTIVHTANTFADYGKGHLPLMDAVAQVRSQGYDVRLRFVGDGPKKEEFRQYARSLGIEEAVEFTGRLPSAMAVREKVRQCDMFVFPTKAEGLPRGLLEAMAEGLPCLSSPTCGVPEVLEENCLIDYTDAQGFAKAIIHWITHPDEMTAQSKRNLEAVKPFASSLLNEKRTAFYRQLREKAEQPER